MSIRVKMAIVLVLVLGMGSVALVFTLRGAYLRNLNLVSEELIADSGRQYEAISSVLGEPGDAAQVEAVLATLKEQSGNDFAIVLSEEEASGWTGLSAWSGDEGLLLVASTEGLDTGDARVPADLPDDGEKLALEQSEGETRVIGAYPVTLGSGANAALVVVHDMSVLATEMNATRIRALILLAGLNVTVMVVVIVMLNSLVFSRVQKMLAQLKDATTCLAGGDFDVAYQRTSDSNDEIGRFESFLYEFIKTVAQTLKALSRAA